MIHVELSLYKSYKTYNEYRVTSPCGKFVFLIFNRIDVNSHEIHIQSYYGSLSYCGNGMFRDNYKFTEFAGTLTLHTPANEVVACARNYRLTDTTPKDNNTIRFSIKKTKLERALQ